MPYPSVRWQYLAPGPDHPQCLNPVSSVPVTSVVTAVYVSAQPIDCLASYSELWRCETTTRHENMCFSTRFPFCRGEAWQLLLWCTAKFITVEPLSNDHPHQRPSLSYDHISCDGLCFMFVYESLTSDHPSYTTIPV